MLLSKMKTINKLEMSNLAMKKQATGASEAYKNVGLQCPIYASRMPQT